jgi:hypothetical protein
MLGMAMSEREKFEKWASANEFSIELTGGEGRGFYVDLETAIAYSGWQAALSTRKPYGYGIVDKDGRVVIGTSVQIHATKYQMEGIAATWSERDGSSYRVCEIFYEDQS